jgi:hypothetical protein
MHGFISLEKDGCAVCTVRPPRKPQGLMHDNRIGVQAPTDQFT